MLIVKVNFVFGISHVFTTSVVNVPGSFADMNMT